MAINPIKLKDSDNAIFNQMAATEVGGNRVPTVVPFLWNTGTPTPIDMANGLPIRFATGETITVNALTDAQLRASPVTVAVPGIATATNQAATNASLSAIDLKLPALVSGRVPVDIGASPLTDSQLRASAIAVSTGLTPLTDTQLRSAPVTVSGTVNLGTVGDSATSVLQTVGNNNLSAIDGKLPALSSLSAVPVHVYQDIVTVSVTPNLLTVAYTDAKVMFQPVELPNVSRVPGKPVILRTLQAFDRNNQFKGIDVFLFNDSVPNQTLNAFWSMTFTDFLKLGCRWEIFGDDWASYNGYAVADRPRTEKKDFYGATPVGTSLWLVAVHKGTGTYAANGLTFRFTFERC